MELRHSMFILSAQQLCVIFLPMKAPKSFFSESFWDLWVLQIYADFTDYA